MDLFNQTLDAGRFGMCKLLVFLSSQQLKKLFLKFDNKQLFFKVTVGSQTYLQVVEKALLIIFSQLSSAVFRC